MAPRRLRAVAWVVVATVAGGAACGPDERPAATPSTPGAADGATAAPAGARATAGAPPAATDDDKVRAEVRRLTDVWRNSENSAEIEAAVAALAKGGERYASVLAEWLVGEDEDLRDHAEALLRRMGRAAVAPLLALLADPDARVRKLAASLLEALTPSWRAAPEGPAVCRALLAGLEDPAVFEAATTALANARPAAAAIALELAQRWAARDVAGCAEAKILRELGTDAAAAASIAAELLAGPDVSLRDEALRILSALGGAAPEVLPRIAALLGSKDEEQRAAAATVLAAWGEAASSQAPFLAAMLRDPAEDVRSAAATALGAMPGAAPKFARELVRAAFESEDAFLYEASEAVQRLARNPEFAAALLRMLPGLNHREMINCWNALDRAGVDLGPVAAQLAQHADPAFRGMALAPWDSPRAKDVIVPIAVRLLDDPDPQVRSYAAETAAEHGAVPAARIREVASALAGSSDDTVRASAIAALGWISTRDPSVLAVLLDALSDDFKPTRLAAIEALARDDTPIPGDQRRAAELLADALFDVPDAQPAALAMLRFDGGEQRLVEVLRVRLRLAENGQLSDDPSTLADAIAVLGARGAPLRRYVEAWAAGGDTRAVRALAAITRDPVALARDGGAGSVAALLAMGPAGRRAVPLFVGKREEEDLDEALADAAGADLGEEIAAATALPDDADDVTDWRRGAARLARTLPLDRALAILDALSDPQWFDVHEDVVATLEAMERAHPGTVPVATIVRHFADEDETARESALRLVAELGPRAKDAVPALRAARKSEHVADQFLAAIALSRVTGDPEEALVAIRPALALPHIASVFTPWTEIGDSLAAVRLSDADRELLFRALPQATDEYVKLALVRAILPLGAAAAPALPTLREILSADGGGRGMTTTDVDLGETTCRVLAAIGPAARAAIPDVQSWIAATGDASGAGRQAVAAMSAAR